MSTTATVLPVAEQPWRSGWRAARANFVPGLILQAIALILVLAYYWHPPTRALFARLTELRIHTGLLFSITATGLCGGILPFLYLRLHPATRRDYTWRSGVFFTLFWAAKGIEIDYWYQLLAWLVGNDTTPRTVVLKVLLDQFVYSPLWAVTITVLAYAWHHAGFRLAPLVADFHAGRWYQRQILPGVVANFGLWVPLTFLIYALPLPLQLPLFDLVLVFYTLLITHITRSTT
ncbi:MAG: hypothetical protein KA257_02815 [Opitutaceae bacterium]|nr:hypothetical protein [Opitutaceae bacterium]MBP9912915.1 hypothetical protein [Opitutaceae bacterium]